MTAHAYLMTGDYKRAVEVRINGNLGNVRLFGKMRELIGIPLEHPFSVRTDEAGWTSWSSEDSVDKETSPLVYRAALSVLFTDEPMDAGLMYVYTGGDPGKELRLTPPCNLVAWYSVEKDYSQEGQTCDDVLREVGAGLAEYLDAIGADWWAENSDRYHEWHHRTVVPI